MGLTEKGKSGRLALCFATQRAMDEFRKANGFSHVDPMGRWKITGIPVGAGVEGVLRLLVSLKRDVQEIVFHDDKQCIFLSKTGGRTVRRMFQGMP